MTIERKTLITLLCILSVAAFLTAWWVWRGVVTPEREQVEAQQAEQRHRFADFVDRSGNIVPIAVDDGTVKVVTHWASWCVACQNDLAVLAQLGESVSGDAVRLIALNRNESPTMIDAYLSSIAFSETAAVTIAIDATDTHYAAVGGYTMPETVIYNREGRLVQHIRGPLDKPSLEAAITAALE
jgi:thiol-disulfide isomerase/thioredoxin